MDLQWILSPVTQCAMFAVGLGLAVYLFLTLKIEIRAASGRGRAEGPGGEIGQLRAQVEELAARQRVNEQWSAALAAPAVPPSGFHLSRRSQALRLYRRGESPDHIASSLGMASGEVGLLVKIYEMTAEAGRASSTLKSSAGPADMTREDTQSPWGPVRSPNED
jgi:hypothetical protein